MMDLEDFVFWIESRSERFCWVFWHGNFVGFGHLSVRLVFLRFIRNFASIYQELSSCVFWTSWF